MSTDLRNKFVVAVSLAFLLTSATTVTAGHVTPFLNWDASVQPAAGGIWSSTTVNQDREWVFDDLEPPTLVAVSGDRPGITAAYRFNDTTVDEVTADSFEGIGDTASASFELWFKPDNLTGVNQVLWETGGSRGAGLSLNGAVTGDNDTANLRFATTTGFSGTTYNVIYTLGTDEIASFVQVVGVVDMVNGNTRMYVNGQPAGTNATVTNDWAGPDGAGLGVNNGYTGGWTGNAILDNFVGQIAIMRFYQVALTDGEVLTSFNEVAVPEPASGVLLLVGLALLPVWRRRRRR